MGKNEKCSEIMDQALKMVDDFNLSIEARKRNAVKIKIINRGSLCHTVTADPTPCFYNRIEFL